MPNLDVNRSTFINQFLKDTLIPASISKPEPILKPARRKLVDLIQVTESPIAMIGGARRNSRTFNLSGFNLNDDLNFTAQNKKITDDISSYESQIAGLEAMMNNSYDTDIELENDNSESYDDLSTIVQTY